mgnify:CR=1 FL=1
MLVNAQVIEKSLNNNNWKFRKKNDKFWLSATVPGTVHTDLLENKLISDPFYGDNEKQLQWIENEDWEYKSNFKISKFEFAQSHIELQFDGLDTYAKVFVNDSLVLIADNMFRSWKVDVKKYVHTGKNKLLIVFESAVKRGKEEAKKLSYTLPGDEKVFTRKAQYQYGWDWGPRFVTCGIWKNVKLVCWNDARILNVKFIQNLLNDSLAKLEFICEIQSDVDANAYLDVALAEEDVSDQMTIKIALKKGVNAYSVPYTIKGPQLWWCNGLGFPTLYGFKIHLSYDSRFLDEEDLEIGLRTIELIQDKDSIGKSFYFKLNGVPVFMKGANYIPPDNFLPRVKKEQYETIIENAVDANVNMLRVWGGGVYADDAFYEACDKSGILVWQDFMFACGMYPGDDHFIENVAEEIIGQVERLRNHPCIALWCGNNEVDEGWKNWGWQKQYKYSVEDSTTIAHNNFALFDNFINDIVDMYDGRRPYWPSSPSIGWGHKESLEQGDSHYWGVWWGMEPFEMYKKKVGRFVSEYGFQGMPAYASFWRMGVMKDESSRYDSHHTMDLSNIPAVIKVDSVNLLAHQKHPTGYQTIQTYMERDYIVPKNNFENYVYVSQLLQAKGMKTAIEAHRRAKPYCLGTLYWQLNDCWPVTSWSSFDYYGDWKASHFQVKRSYENTIISIDETDTICNVYLISDDLIKKVGTLRIQLLDFTGKIIWSDSIAAGVSRVASEKVYTFNNKLLANINTSSIVLKVTFTEFKKSEVIAEALHYFEKPRNLNLKRPTITIVNLSANTIELTTDVLAKDVMLFDNQNYLNFSDNYFDLIPNETKIIVLKPKSDQKKVLDNLFIYTKSLIDTY